MECMVVIQSVMVRYARFSVKYEANHCEIVTARESLFETAVRFITRSSQNTVIGFKNIWKRLQNAKPALARDAELVLAVKIGTAKVLSRNLLTRCSSDLPTATQRRCQTSARWKCGTRVWSFDPTSGGPPRKMVPCLRTMMLSSAMAGTYAPPAVQEPITTAI